MNNEMAVIHALWVGEVKPDRGSSLIQRVIGADYSHNCFIYEKTGMLWEATFDDDQRNCGVISRPPHLAMKGCVIRARKRIQLSITNDGFEQWLDEERNKPYAHKQNFGAIFKWWQAIYSNGNDKRNCSELLAAACQWSSYKFPRNKDYITPRDTFRVIKPDIVNEIVDSAWRFRVT